MKAIKQTDLLVISLCLFLSGCSHGNLLTNVRDRDAVPMPGNDPVIHFIVSYNDDDDDRNGTMDYSQAAPTAAEDNLRELRFAAHPGAVRAVLAAPQYNDTTGRMAIGDLVRAWKSDRRTPFPFNTPQPLPLTVYFEGIKTAAKLDQFLFEYAYLDAQGRIVGQGLAYGSVVELKTETSMQPGADSRLLHANRKLLITASAGAKASVAPGQPRVIWRHPRVTFSNAANLQTNFTAGTAVSPVLDRDMLSIEVTIPGQTGAIIGEGPLNIVAPDAVTVDRWEFPRGWTQGAGPPSATTANANRDVTWISRNYPIPQNVRTARRQRTDFFDGRVYYRINDQFGAAIADAAKGRNARVVIREHVPLRSVLPATANTIDNLQPTLNRITAANTTPNWTNAPANGEFRDHLQLYFSPSHFMTAAGGVHLVVTATGTDMAVMQRSSASPAPSPNGTHDWHVGVRNRRTVHRDTTVTHNQLTVEIDSVNLPQNQMRFRSTYLVR